MAKAPANPTVVIEDTKDFLNAADVIYEKLKVDDRGRPQDFSFACPFTVLSCYAIESGIKNLLIKNGVPFGREHDLLKLFKLLPTGLKKKVFFSPSAFWAQGIYQETPEEIFLGLLEKTKTNFIDARYFFEQKENDVEICVGFLNTVSHIIFDLLSEEK